MDVTAMRLAVGDNLIYVVASFSFSLLRLDICYQVNVLKPSHKSTLQSKIMKTPGPVPDSVSAVPNATNATRDLDSELDAGPESKIREIVMDNAEPESMNQQLPGISLGTRCYGQYITKPLLECSVEIENDHLLITYELLWLFVSI